MEQVKQSVLGAIEEREREGKTFSKGGIKCNISFRKLQKGQPETTRVTTMKQMHQM